MPAKIKKVGSKYQVSTPNAVHAKGTTKAKAEAQQRLLNAVEHGWVPTGASRKVHHSPTMTEVNCHKLHMQDGSATHHAESM